MDYVPESVFEEILASVLEERFPETESLTEHQRKALLDMESQLYFSCSLMSANTCFPVRLFIPPHGIILVVCPLKSLVDSHLRELRNRGISAASLSSEDVDENHSLKRTYSFVFGSPESFLQNEKWRNMLRNDVYQDRTFAIVMDCYTNNFPGLPRLNKISVW